MTTAGTIRICPSFVDAVATTGSALSPLNANRTGKYSTRIYPVTDSLWHVADLVYCSAARDSHGSTGILSTDHRTVWPIATVRVSSAV